MIKPDTIMQSKTKSPEMIDCASAPKVQISVMSKFPGTDATVTIAPSVLTDGISLDPDYWTHHNNFAECIVPRLICIKSFH